jgi:peptidoglycan hydrolase FlgJ
MFIPSSSSSKTSILPQMEQGRMAQLRELAKPGKSKNNKQLKSLAKEFESIFVHQLLKSMRSTVQKSGFFDSHATKMYESLHDEELSKLMTEQKGIGLAEVIYRDLARLEEKTKKEQSESEIVTKKINSAINLKG